MKEEVVMADCITCCHGQNPRRRGTEKSNCQKQPERQTSIGNPPLRGKQRPNHHVQKHDYKNKGTESLIWTDLTLVLHEKASANHGSHDAELKHRVITP